MGRTATALRIVAPVVPISLAVAGEAVFQSMIRGFAARCGSRGYDASFTIGVVQRFSRWADAHFEAPYPWQWTRAMGEIWIDELWRLPSLEGGRELELTTAGGYQGQVRRFCEYVCDTDYPDPHAPWTLQCQQQFGRGPIVIFDSLNSIKRSADSQSRQTKRLPFSRAMLTQIFDYLDDRIEAAKGKSKAPAARDAAIFKLFYAYGIRNTEGRLLVNPHDFSPSAEFPDYGQYAGIWIRHGKGSNGSGPKTRFVRTVPKFDWVVRVLHEYVHFVRPRLLGDSASTALFPSEKNGKSFLSLTALDDIWAKIRDELGIGPEFKIHCFRHSYMTHLIEAGYPAKFIQLQVGHTHLGSMATYTSSLGDPFLNAVMRHAHAQMLKPLIDPADIAAVADAIPDEYWKP
ncbi:MAG TPA: tyrosine-type recombinase/integrase [Candidatus Tumulicola sp.]|jgi:integrase